MCALVEFDFVFCFHFSHKVMIERNINHDDNNNDNDIYPLIILTIYSQIGVLSNSKGPWGGRPDATPEMQKPEDGLDAFKRQAWRYNRK